MTPGPSRPIEKNVLLVGAGNAHLRFVRTFGMKPTPGVAVALVSEAATIPYSAMVPGHIAGDYPRDAITIDLVRLCRAMGVRFVAARAVAIDPLRRCVEFADRPELRYDLVSLGLGSVPARPDGANGPNSWSMRPLGELLDRIDDLDRRLRESPRPFRFVVVGGGASGCELALALAKRFATIPDFHVTLVHSNPHLLPQFPTKAARIFQRLFEDRTVAVKLDARVTGANEKTLQLNGTDRLPYDVVLWATNAAPPAPIRDSGLPLDSEGFLRVSDTLQSVADPTVFGTGDCISIEQHPHLLKNGVYAVRQGAILFENVVRTLREKRPLRFQPQRRCLCLMNTADGQAALCYGPFVLKGRLARRLKDRIDRAWIESFTPEPMDATAEDESPTMRCGGCGNKIAGDVLSAVLKRIDAGDDPRILMGTKAGEDASVHRMRPDLFGRDPEKLVEVQTVDYFKSFVDDPYLFGRVAAIHAVSDLFAMNARPFSALAIATLPYARGPVQEAMLYELLRGAVESLRSLGVTLTGGHTTEGPELALGFAVTGHGEEDRLFHKGGLIPGQKLVLTKPLGSGAILAAWMRGACRAEWFAGVIAGLLQANDRAATVLAAHGVTACTDVTGFGLAGHLTEMLDASRVGATLDPRAVPLYAGFAEVVRSGIVSTLQRDNAKLACRLADAAEPPAWLFDPQTSGGLLAGVEPHAVEAVLRELPGAVVIGEVTAGAAVISLESRL